MLDYTICITIFDSPRAIKSTKSFLDSKLAYRLRHFTSSIPDTPTGLPPDYDSVLRSLPGPFAPKDLFEDLSQADEKLRAAAASEAERVAVSIPNGRKKVQIPPPRPPQLDYRFGPVGVDWIDMKDWSGSRSITRQHSQDDAEGSGASTSKASSQAAPVAKFTPHHASFAESSKAGSVELGYGVISLFRDVSEAVIDSDQGANEPRNGKNALPSPQSSQMQPQGSSSSSNHPNRDDQDDGTTLAVLAVPSYFTAGEFLNWVAPASDSIRQLRLLRDVSPNKCLVLVKFKSPLDAHDFAEEFNGKPYYHHIDPAEVCHVVRVRSIVVRSTISPPFSFPFIPGTDDSQQLVPSSIKELPTCPVCLERMDTNVTGLITILCQHTFHCHCLSKWGDSRCPVCRYSQLRIKNPSQPPSSASECFVCGATADLWICLICGHVGCGRYQGGHAYKHFEDTAHCFALDLESHRVWDYIGDGYVHRLIQKSDGKVVELPSVGSASSTESRRGGPDRDTHANQEKIEAIGIEYDNLLSSQLESQRAFYDERIHELRDQLVFAESKSSRLQEESKSWKKQQSTLEERIEQLEGKFTNIVGDLEERSQKAERERARLEKKAEKAVDLARALEKELQGEREVSKGLMANLARLNAQLDERRAQSDADKDQVRDLEEQLRDLMFSLEARDKIEAAGGELAGGTVGVVPSPASPSSKPPGSGRKKKR